MPSRANLFRNSNAVTLLSSGLSKTGFENVIYCSTIYLYTTDAGPIQNFTATSLSGGIPYYQKKKHLSITSILSNYLITVFISKLSIEKTSTDNEMWLQRAGGLQGENWKFQSLLI